MSPSRAQQRPRRPQPINITGRPYDGRVQVVPIDQPPEGATNPDAKPHLSFAAPAVCGKTPRHLADLDLSGRKAVCRNSGLSFFRADQLSRHYFTHFTYDSADVTDLPAIQREQLCTELLPGLTTPVRVLRADGGRTTKHLWELHGGVRVKGVLIRYEERTTPCTSSQAGYGMACPFYAIGQMDLTRDLSTGEVVEQVRHAAQAPVAGELTGDPARLSNAVFTDTGEPMVNYRSAVGALHRLIDLASEDFDLLARGITVSIAGLVPLIRRLTGEGLSVILAVSLHAPDDKLCNEFIPVNSKWKVGELLDAAHDYFLTTDRCMSTKYTLIKDMNDHT